MSVEEHDDKVSMAMYDASVVGIVSCLAGSAAITRLLSTAVTARIFKYLTSKLSK